MQTYEKTEKKWIFLLPKSCPKIVMLLEEKDILIFLLISLIFFCFFPIHEHMGLQKQSGIYTETRNIYSAYTYKTGVDNSNAIPKVYFNVKTSDM